MNYLPLFGGGNQERTQNVKLGPLPAPTYTLEMKMIGLFQGTLHNESVTTKFRSGSRRLAAIPLFDRLLASLSWDSGGPALRHRCFTLTGYPLPSDENYSPKPVLVLFFAKARHKIGNENYFPSIQG